jgi:GNAT superfamily N-acetyltransferase
MRRFVSCQLQTEINFMKKDLMMTKFARLDQLQNLEDMSSDQVLAGINGDVDRVVIDDVFKSSYKLVCQDYFNSVGVSLETGGALFQARNTPTWNYVQSHLVGQEAILSNNELGVKIVDLIDQDGAVCGLAALLDTQIGDDTYRIRGLLYGSTLVVDPLYRNFGIGKQLVLARMLTCGDLPTWDHDTPGYSYGGAETVKSAHNEFLVILDCVRSGQLWHAESEIAKYGLSLDELTQDIMANSMAPR